METTMNTAVKRPYQKKDKGKVFRTVIFLILGIIFVMPFILLVMNSFKTYNDMAIDFLAPPRSFYLGNYIEAVSKMHFVRALLNSVIVTVGTMVYATLISFLAAYGTYHIHGRLGKFFYLLFTLGQIVPFHSIMIALSVQLRDMGLNNSFIALIGLYAGFHCCFGIFTYYGFMKQIPKELEEAAEIDGCGVIKSMWKIVFPMLRSTTITINVLFFLWTWNDFLMPSLYLGKDKKTLTVMIYMFKSTSGSQWNLLLAGLVLAIIPVIVIYIVAQKYITEGLTAGAVKG